MSISTAFAEDRRAAVDHDIHDLLVERWSPRAFDPAVSLTDPQVDSLLEAARWAPSAANSQPRRFILGRRGTELFDQIFGLLNEGNRAWAGNAAALLVAIAVNDGGATRWAEYDLGQSVAQLTVQAHALGLHVHTVGGFDVAGVAAAFELPENMTPVTISAIGEVGDPDSLPEAYAARERLPRERRSLDELVLARS